MKGVSIVPALLILVLLLLPAHIALAAPPTGGEQISQSAELPVLPDPVELVIGAAITFLVVNGLKDFSNFVGQDLSGWGTVIAAGATAIVVFSINTMLQVAVTIDPSLAPKVTAFFQILVILLGAMGFKRMQRASI